MAIGQIRRYSHQFAIAPDGDFVVLDKMAAISHHLYFMLSWSLFSSFIYIIDLTTFHI